MPAKSAQPKCKIMTTTDGRKVRVRGNLDQDQLDVLAAAVDKHYAGKCHHEGPHLMPAIAQKIHGRKHYTCGEDKDHEGKHRWGSREW